MLGLLANLFGGAGQIASELIDTPLEKAQAQVLKIKAMDPNGQMRRDLSRFACRAYGFYLVVMSSLSFMVAFGIGDAQGAESAASMLVSLFLPITTSWAGIVAASFGVNATNVIKDKG